MPNDMIVSRRMAQVEIIKTVNAVREAYGLPNPIIADALRAVLMDLTQAGRAAEHSRRACAAGKAGRVGKAGGNAIG